jgi:hypothetical protein
MINKGIVEGFPNYAFKFKLCQPCIYGKQNHVRFPSRATRAKGILECVHSDFFGLVLIPSLGGSMYYVS